MAKNTSRVSAEGESNKEDPYNQSKVKKLKQGIKNLIVEALLNTTMHGLPEMIRAKYISLKLMWFICFFGSTGACFFLIVRSVMSYLSYEVVTT